MDEKHNNDLSWNGDFSLEDLAVQNRKFVILKEATEKASKEHIFNDWMKMTEELFPLYKIDMVAPNYSSFVEYIINSHHDGQAYVDYFNEQHLAGHSWNGELGDMDIKDGKPVVEKPATKVADNDSKYQDFKNLLLKLCPEYKVNEPAPAYLDIIQKDIIRKMDLYDTDPAKFRTFQKFLPQNPAWKPPLVLSSCSQNVHKVCNSLRKMAQDGKRALPDKLQTLISTEIIYSWQFVAQNLWGFDRVYKHDNANGARYNFKTFFCFLEYIRHLDTHLLDFTKDPITGEQVLDVEEVFLWIGEVYEEVVPELVFKMMFYSSWRLYKNSECGDVEDNTVSASGTAADVQSAGHENASSGIIGPDTGNENTSSGIIVPAIDNLKYAGNESGPS